VLFDAGNPYARPVPDILELSWEDFECRLSAANEAALDKSARWGVLGYFAADVSDLAAYMFDDLLQMKSVGSSDGVHVCAFFDGPLVTDTLFARLNAGASFADDIVVRFNKRRSNDSATLTLALGFADSYPAERRLVFMSGHGGGWRGGFLDENLGMLNLAKKGRLRFPGPDDRCETHLRDCRFAVGEILNARRLARPRPSRPVDVLALDACYMGSLEAVSFLANEAEVIVVSEEQMPAEGYPYDTVLAHLRDHPEQSPLEAASYLVSETKHFYDERAPSRRIAQVAIASERLPAFVEALRGVVVALGGMEDDAEFTVVRRAIQHSWSFPATGSIDIKGFLQKLEEHPRADVRAARATALERWDSLVVAASVGGTEDTTNGLAIYAPPAKDFDVSYLDQSNQFRSDLGIWPWFLASYYLRLLGAEGPNHPLLLAIQATMRDMIRRGLYPPQPAS
jgi:hypothetical protein